jgi:glycosyltransferase involved in cell wall biosynthesis
LEADMISLVVPTHNRAHTLRRVAPSYFTQDGVDEVVFVDDGGQDDTADVIARIASMHPEVRWQLLRNEQRQGAAQARNIGVQACRNEYVLFCDDDEYLEPGYARICLAKLTQYGAGAVSGRRVYMNDDETPEQAVRRFGEGLRSSAPFRRLACEYVNGARFTGDLQLPITNAVILTRRALLIMHPFDPSYIQGNGYREESDFQMNLYVHGHDIWVTNDTHSIHLPASVVRNTGSRNSPWFRIYWQNRYTRHFFGKYYAAYARRLGLSSPRSVALAAFFVFSLYKEFLHPTLRRLALSLRARPPEIAAVR